MYQLEIWGPKGRRVLRWDPRKVAQRDPKTMAVFAEADRLLKESLSRSRTEHDPNTAPLRLAASGRWIE